MRRRLNPRWIVVAVIVAVGAYLAADVVALQFHQSQGAAQLARALAAEEASLELGSLPFLPGYVRGRLSSIDVGVKGATATGGLRVAEVSARFTSVRFSWSRLFALVRSRFSSRTEIVADEVIGSLTLAEDDLDEFIGREVPFAEDVDVTPEGVRVFFGAPIGLGSTDDDRPSARFIPRIEEGELVLRLVGAGRLPTRFRSDAAAIERSIELPPMPDGLRATIRLGEGVVVVEVSGREVVFSIGEGDR